MSAVDEARVREIVREEPSRLAPESGPLHPLTRHAVADELLSYVASRDLLLGEPPHVGTEGIGYELAVRPSDQNARANSGRPVGVLPHAFEVLLNRALHVERDLAELGYVRRPGLRYDLTTAVNNNGDLSSAVSAVIDDDGGTVVVDLEHPVVRDVVLSDPQRPLGDLIRVASELVRIFRDAVCLLGLPESIRSCLTGGLREAVALLRELVRAERGTPGYASGSNASEPRDDASPVGNGHNASPSSVGSTPSVGEPAAPEAGIAPLASGAAHQVGAK